ncbi:MAG: glycoside hydrolase family 25 protein [Ruminococcus sp.]|nr:glycoside hydrolase family 25 protein [Ruminococcus sp.]
MRKFLSVITIGSMLMTAAFCGCSQQNQSPPASGAATANDSKISSPASADSSAYTSAAGSENSADSSDKKVRVSDSALGQIWIDELEGVKKNTLNNESFTSDGTFKYYGENGNPSSLVGIDVSSYNGDINWSSVKNSGVDFVMVRLGGRGYGEDGTLYQDDRAAEYIKGAQSAGLKAGGYFFSQAVTNDEAVEEADKVKEILGDLKPDFPIAYDWEIIKEDEARTDKVSAEQATDCANAFCRQIAAHGYTPLLYSTSRELYFKYDLSKLADIDIWYSEYEDTPGFYYQFSMWQYSKTGQVDGIEGTVDLNICFTDIADYAK